MPKISKLHLTCLAVCIVLVACFALCLLPTHANAAAVTSERTIPDGIYNISTASRSSLWVALGEKENGEGQLGTNVELGNKDKQSSAQKWKIVWEGKSYRIISIATGKVLGSASKQVGANVRLYSKQNIKSQRWAISKNAKGVCTFTNMATGQVLDIQDGSLVNGANVQMYTSNGTAAQKFTLKPARLISEGLQSIGCQDKVGYYLSAPGKVNDETKVRLKPYDTSFSLKYIVERVGKQDVYTFKSINSGLYLAVEQGRVVQTSDPTLPNAQWEASFLKGIMLKNVATGKMMTAKTTGTKAAKKSKQKTQRFYFRAAPLVNTGSYALNNRAGKTLSVEGDNVEIWKANGNWSQQFYFTPSGSYYRIKALAYDKFVAVADESKANGANVELQEGSNNDAQKWKVELTGDGYLKLTNKATGKVLDLSNASKENGTNVVQRKANATRTQQWHLDDGSGDVQDEVEEWGIANSSLKAKAAYNAYKRLSGKESVSEIAKVFAGKGATVISENNAETVVWSNGKTWSVTIEFTNGRMATKAWGSYDESMPSEWSDVYGAGEKMARLAIQLSYGLWEKDGQVMPRQGKAGNPRYNADEKYPKLYEYYCVHDMISDNSGTCASCYAECNVCVGTIIAAAYDPSSRLNNTSWYASCYNHLGRGWANMGTVTTSEIPRKCKPGDVVARTTHVVMYVGNDLVREYYPEASSDVCLYENKTYPALTSYTGRAEQSWTIYRPTGDIQNYVSGSLCVDLEPYGLANADYYDPDAHAQAIKRVLTHDGRYIPANSKTGESAGYLGKNVSNDSIGLYWCRCDELLNKHKSLIAQLGGTRPDGTPLP